MNRILHWIKHARPADWIRLIKKLLPHVMIVISGMLIVFFVIDRVNKPMGFMTNEFHKRLTFVLAILAIYYAIQNITLQRRLERAEYQRRLKAARKRQVAAPSRSQARPAARPSRPPVTTRPTASGSHKIQER